MQFQSAKALVFGSRLFLLTQSKVYNQCIVRLSFNMPFVRWFRVHFGSLKLNTMCALRAEFHFERSIDCLSLVDFVYFYFFLKPHRISAIRFVSPFFLSFFLSPFFAFFFFLDTLKWISINVFAFMSFLHRPYSALPSAYSVYTSTLGKCNIHIAFTSSELRTVFNLYACNCNKRIECTYIEHGTYIAPSSFFSCRWLIFLFFASSICV